MKKLILVALTCVCYSNLFAQTDLVLATLDTIGVEAAFPESPIIDVVTIPDQLGEIKVKMAFHMAPNLDSVDNLMYMVSATEYPKGLVNPNNPQEVSELYHQAVDAAAANSGGILRSERTFQYESYSGKALEIDLGGEATLNTRMVLVGETMFLFQVMTKPDKVGNLLSNEFFDSFKILSTQIAPIPNPIQ